ncbi:arylsulfatase [Teichococcus oryzae]|uniref:Arylsulfatase n=1 Tax=Teichococcus oryzae TaxID=1608942 RepID=A0A5B2TIG8_9PROT|nr:arylsulfatase [Pseudoroseomonas oryzae]KAA2213580.1 arylsulfatase [Pseudoroseomonas oryzae]
MTGSLPRIALIHALRHSPPPVEEAFSRLWPEARLMNLLDDSLSADLMREGELTDRMTGRFLDLARYAVGTGADGILFTCSAFGPCIDACREALAPLPVLKPNEAMIEEAVAAGGTIGLLASFAPTLRSMPPEFPAGTRLHPRLAEGALEALNAGDVAAHNRLAAQAAAGLEGCDIIALAQFSLASAAPAIVAATGKPVLTTPDSAVRKMRRLLGA